MTIRASRDALWWWWWWWWWCGSSGTTWPRVELGLLSNTHYQDSSTRLGQPLWSLVSSISCFDLRILLPYHLSAKWSKYLFRFAQGSTRCLCFVLLAKLCVVSCLHLSPTWSSVVLGPLWFRVKNSVKACRF